MSLEYLIENLRENFDKLTKEEGLFNRKIERLTEFCNNYYTYDLSCKDLPFVESLKRRKGVCKHWGDLFRLGLWYILTRMGGKRIDKGIRLDRIEIEFDSVILYPMGNL